MTKAHRYELDINSSDQDMARHSGVTGLPVRVRKPRYQAAAELGVALVPRWILAALRQPRLFSLPAANREIRRLPDQLDDRTFRKRPGDRRERFEEIDRPALKPLPAPPHAFAEWKQVRVHVDYPVEFGPHDSSVPGGLVGLELDLRITRHTIECLHQGKRVASPLRSRRTGHSHHKASGPYACRPVDRLS